MASVGEIKYIIIATLWCPRASTAPGRRIALERTSDGQGRASRTVSLQGRAGRGLRRRYYKRSEMEVL